MKDHSLRQLTRAVRKKLDPTGNADQDFKGQRGAAQSSLYFAFKDMGMPFRPLATQSLSNYYFGHAAGIVPDFEDGKVYLIDPTFKQFQHTELDAIPPADILAATEEGRFILTSLLEDGYVELTAERARLYLEAFLNGESIGLSDEEALDFITNPPDHRFHLIFSSDDTLKATPKHLRDWGLWIDTNDL